MRILLAFGTRPEAIKLAPVIHALRDRFDLHVVSTGQHRELLDQVLEFFHIAPNYSFRSMNRKPDLTRLQGRIQREMSGILERKKPQAIIVQGDTMTTYCTAFQGFLHKIPVFHIEAGLRTFNKFSPFPEEMARTFVSRIADVHFTPTASARENLLREHVRPDRIITTGNTVVDALLLAQRLIDPTRVRKELSRCAPLVPERLNAGKLVLITSHRRENIGAGLLGICRAINALARRHPNLLFLWSLHRNPEVRCIVLKELDKNLRNIVIAEAFSYETTVSLLRHARVILTDSGGIQEEAPTFNKPIIILREQTERPEVVTAGMGFLTGADERKIIATFERLCGATAPARKRGRIANPYGDGKASQRIQRFFLNPQVQTFLREYPASFDRKLRIPSRTNGDTP